MTAYRTAAALPTWTAPRSDGRTLHVDFEHYVDDVRAPLNAGVRRLENSSAQAGEHRVEVIDDPAIAYSGTRCGYASTQSCQQAASIELQRCFDAPEANDGEVTEFVFSPAFDEPVDLNDFCVWAPRAYAGGPVSVTILARGLAKEGTYHLDVKDVTGRICNVVTGLPQMEWAQLILTRHRATKSVELWIVHSGGEDKVGSFVDRDARFATGRAQLGVLQVGAGVGTGYWDDVRIGQRLATCLTVAPSECLRNVGDHRTELEVPVRVGREKQLFVDDLLIESLAGLKRTLHPAVKHPKNPIVVPQERWEINGKWFLPYRVLRPGPAGKFLAWVGSYRQAKTKLIYTGLLESEDGLDWTRPRVGRVSFSGSKDNNIVWRGRGIRPLYDPHDENPQRRYKAMTRVGGFSPMFSPDGRQWRMGRANFDQGFDATDFHWDPVFHKWIASCKIYWQGKRGRGYAESWDFARWSDTYLMLNTDSQDAPQDEIYSQRIFRYESVYVSLVKIYHVATDRCELQLAFSRNGRAWQRPDRTCFLANSPREGAYDFGNIDETGDPIRIGDELWFYYSGRRLRHGGKPVDDGGLCLATLRLDGFKSIDATDRQGVLTTKPLVLDGSRLFVNADCGRGEIQVEIIDGQGAVSAVPTGLHAVYAKTQCVPIEGDAVREQVRWTGSTGGCLPQDGRMVRLRFYLRNARLFAFWTE